MNQLDVRWCIHFEFFRREAKNYPSGNFRETTTKLIDLERYAQFQQEEGHFESIQAMFVTYVPPIFEKSAFAQRTKKSSSAQSTRTRSTSSRSSLNVSRRC